jgi:antitoxin (DNA-binding transcriptional repressor) of toxin-antitoxin stability system
VNIAIKDTSLEDIVRRVEAGEHVTLTRDGKKIAEIQPAEAPIGERPRLLGAMKSQTWMSDDFDELGPEWDEYIK